jgi:hypothetical protein
VLGTGGAAMVSSVFVYDIVAFVADVVVVGFVADV